MKRKHLIIIIGQSITIALLFVYAMVQQTAARRVERDALAAVEWAEKNKLEADRQRQLAEKNAMEALSHAEEVRRQQALCEELRKKSK